MVHAETLEKDECIDGAFLTEKVRDEVKSHAIAFLFVVRGEIRRIAKARTTPKG